MSCACPDTGTHTLWCTNDRISVFFLVCGSSRQLEKCAPTVTVHRSGHRRLVTSTTATPSRHGAWFHDVESGRLPADLDMHSICVGMPHWRARTYACCPCGCPYYCQSPAAGCKFAERATSFVVGDCAMCLANQTSTTHCLTGVLTTLATPTNCAESAEFMVPRSGLGTVAPLRDPFVDDGVCSALLFPKLTSTVHGTAGLLGNAMWAMLTRIGQVLHAIVGRAPCLILFVQLAWSLGVGQLFRFVSDSCRVGQLSRWQQNTCK